MIFNMLLCLTHKSNNNFVVFIVMIIVFVHPKLIKLAHLFTTIKMTFFSYHSKRLIFIKFIEILSYGLVKISKGLYNLNFLLWINLMFSISHKCVCNVLHLLSFKVNKNFYLKSLLWFCHHIFLPLACHVFFTWI